MTPDRWHRVQDLFDLAMDLERIELGEFVREACGPDSLLLT